MTKQSARFSFHCGWFRGARKLWNCLAFHLVVDDSQRSCKLTLGVPCLITLIAEFPLIPVWLGAHLLTGGAGERAEYGLWHDYHETKFQWRRIINLGGPRGGKEWRKVHLHTAAGEDVARVVRHETIISAWVADLDAVKAWVVDNHIDRWSLVVSTWRAESSRWWIPSLYDHFFVLRAAQSADLPERTGNEKEATIKENISRRLTPEQVFTELAQQISF